MQGYLQFLAGVEKVFRSFTQVKVKIQVTNKSPAFKIGFAFIFKQTNIISRLLGSIKDENDSVRWRLLSTVCFRLIC